MRIKQSGQISILVSLLLVFSGCAITAPEPIDNVAEAQTEIDLSKSPAGGSFGADVDFGQADPSILEIYIDYPQVGQRVQVMATAEGEEPEQLYFFMLSESDLDSDGNYRDSQSIVEEVGLEPGIYMVEILVDGQPYFGPVSHEVPGAPEPEPVQAAPAPSGPRACSAAETESARQVVVYGYLAWGGNQIGEYDKITDFVARMNQGLASSNSAKVDSLLRDGIAWVDAGLNYDTLLSLQQRGQVIVNTGQC
jgi:hypothetical protein